MRRTCSRRPPAAPVFRPCARLRCAPGCRSRRPARSQPAYAAASPGKAEPARAAQRRARSVRPHAKEPWMNPEEKEEDEKADERPLPADLAQVEAVAALGDRHERDVRRRGGEASPVGIGALAPVHGERADSREDQEAAEKDERLQFAEREHM